MGIPIPSEPTQKRAATFSMFTMSDDIVVNRSGKRIMVRGRDGTFEESSTVEANLLFEILKALKKK